MPKLVDVVETFVAQRTLSPAPPAPAAQNPQRAKRRFGGIKLTAAELREIRDAYGPFLSLENAAEIAGLSPKTLKKQLSQGRYANCAKRGKPIRFLTERFVQELFGGARQ